MKPRALVLGAGGFIGSHLVKRLKSEGFWVRGVDRKTAGSMGEIPDEFVTIDLRQQAQCNAVFDIRFDEVYQLAADMGGAGYIFSGAHDAAIMSNSSQINLCVLNCVSLRKQGRIFFSSSACIYPEHTQQDPDAPDCAESAAYPAAPDSAYGWEKLYAERLYAAHAKASGCPTRIGRYHNIYGPNGTWNGGREKAPAALCRKVAEAEEGGAISLWGDGNQTRSFLFIDDCLDATLRLMRSDYAEPLNIGSEEKVTINDLAARIIALSGKRLTIRHEEGPQGVRGRTSNNDLIRERLCWSPKVRLNEGLRTTYNWISDQVRGGVAA